MRGGVGLGSRAPIFAPMFVVEEWMANDAQHCKDLQKRNLWLCYFLPMTKCMLPAHVQSFSNHETVLFGDAIDPSSTDRMMDLPPLSSNNPNASALVGGISEQELDGMLSEETGFGDLELGFLTRHALYRLNYRSRHALAGLSQRFLNSSGWACRSNRTYLRSPHLHTTSTRLVPALAPPAHNKY